MQKQAHKIVQYGPGGWFAEFYRDDDGNSGYGDNPEVAYWFGTEQQCRAVKQSEVTFHPLILNDTPDPFDLACERRYD